MIDIKYSGCNFWINKGVNEYEPIGTATSMHDCEGCDKYESCNMKKDFDVWILTEEDKK